jgi:hypothetical protein
MGSTLSNMLSDKNIKHATNIYSNASEHIEEQGDNIKDEAKSAMALLNLTTQPMQPTQQTRRKRRRRRTRKRTTKRLKKSKSRSRRKYRKR